MSVFCLCHMYIHNYYIPLWYVCNIINVKKKRKKIKFYKPIDNFFHLYFHNT